MIPSAPNITALSGPAHAPVMAAAMKPYVSRGRVRAAHVAVPPFARSGRAATITAA